ncbi:unnamed protein product [Clonostachys chloroleuca]|uniref:F-box domain-containing protein n=1 Tax=Clonostachys chloroleuca TaxID=1926264 RepID=A0AA35M4P7_9HYPO|nr:unnamed protein product [Clonostachys chloroleuca]
MANILTIPPEVVMNILGRLDPFSLESVAKTLSSRLYYPAAQLLAPCKGWMENARAMCKVFNPRGSRGVQPSYPGYLPVLADHHLVRDEIPKRDYQGLGLDQERGPYVRSSPPDFQSWIDLDGSFSWLQSLEKKIADEMEPHTGREGDRPVATKAQIESLVAKAEELGLKLPAGFEAFMADNRLHHRIPSYSAWYFNLSKLVRCPSSVDNGGGGYIVRFYWDQQACAFAYLYLSQSGHHCILMSMLDLYEEMELDEEEIEDGHDGNGDVDKDDILMVALTFEEYLAMVYYEELLEFRAKPFTGLCKYVKHTYIAPAK